MRYAIVPWNLTCKKDATLTKERKRIMVQQPPHVRGFLQVIIVYVVFRAR